MDQDNAGLSLLFRVGTALCGLPLEHVVEIMRPLPVESVSGTPHVIRGLAIIRGVPVPVLDAARLLGVDAMPSTRFVTVDVAGRRVALAVESVLGVRRIPIESLEALPPLLGGVATEIVSAIGRLDAELLFVLRCARLFPEDLVADLNAPVAS